MRRLAPRALLAVSAVAVVLTAAWRQPLSWLDAAFLWAGIGVLTVALMRKGS